MFGREDGLGYKASGRVRFKQLADSDDATRRPPGSKGLAPFCLTLSFVVSVSSFPKLRAAGSHCNSENILSELFVDPLPTAQLRGRGTPAGRCQSGVPHKHFAKDFVQP